VHAYTVTVLYERTVRPRRSLSSPSASGNPSITRASIVSFTILHFAFPSDVTRRDHSIQGTGAPCLGSKRAWGAVWTSGRRAAPEGNRVSRSSPSSRHRCLLSGKCVPLHWAP